MVAFFHEQQHKKRIKSADIKGRVGVSCQTKSHPLHYFTSRKFYFKTKMQTLEENCYAETTAYLPPAQRWTVQEMLGIGVNPGTFYIIFFTCPGALLQRMVQ